MAPIIETIVVARPPAETFAYVTDPARFSEWQQNVTAGSMQSDGSARPGDRCITTRRIGFAQRAITAEVTHIEPPSRWGVRGLDGPIRAAVDVTVTPVDDGHRSEVSIAIDFAGHGIGRLLVPLAVLPRARREMPANLQRLKNQLERSS